MAKMPGKPDAARRREQDKYHDAGMALWGVVTEPHMPEPYRAPRTPTGVYLDRERAFERRYPNGTRTIMTVWREKNGRFAARPKRGERAKALHLPERKGRKR